MNSGSVWMAVAAGGALGALIRGAVYRWIASWSLANRSGTGTRLGLARATLLVNLLGSLLLGIGIALLAGVEADDPMRIFWVTGLCGSLTTFSTFCADALRLARAREHSSLLGYLLANGLLCLAAFSAGLVLVG
jgi:fluoride exporter